MLRQMLARGRRAAQLGFQPTTKSLNQRSTRELVLTAYANAMWSGHVLCLGGLQGSGGRRAAMAQSIAWGRN